jgi:hypothetical protein
MDRGDKKAIEDFLKYAIALMEVSKNNHRQKPRQIFHLKISGAPTSLLII